MMDFARQHSKILCTAKQTTNAARLITPPALIFSDVCDTAWRNCCGLKDFRIIPTFFAPEALEQSATPTLDVGHLHWGFLIHH